MSNFDSVKMNDTGSRDFFLQAPTRHKIGEAIDTPAGILVWGHDYDEPDTGDWIPLYLDTADDWDSAFKKVREHTLESQGAMNPQ